MKTSLLRLLGIVGWDRIEPVILAAVAVDSPLLLIGPHGSGKTLLLTRLAQALELEYRHYNASLLNFDDLIGFPVPENGKLVYLQTPATIWDAEAVFFDEVSRCRPDMQNKLFPIIHERRVQGVDLNELTQRWAAMNPPASEDAVDGTVYAGSEPLDVALADRFGWIVQVPGLGELSAEDQGAMLTARISAPDPEAGCQWDLAIQYVQDRLVASRQEVEPWVKAYVPIFAHQLAEAGHPLSPRRTVTLARNVEALRATLGLYDERLGMEDAFALAARHSLPDAAWGGEVPATARLAAHRIAWAAAEAAVGGDGEKFGILREPDPVCRIRLALDSRMDDVEVATVLADAYGSLPLERRVPTGAVLFPLLERRSGLPAAAVELVARDFAAVARFGKQELTVENQVMSWKRSLLSAAMSNLDRRTRRGQVLTNIIVYMVEKSHRVTLEDLSSAYQHAVRVLGAREAEAA